MANISIKNYTKSNTPKLAQKIGDILLACGAAGAAIVAIPTLLPVVLPASLITAAGWLVGIGTAGKFFTKFLGEK